jgi:3-methylfumaryl-CoA hydratase
VKLFRFSCVTGNAHRIHYDVPYTREVEGYADLVVHGPLLALLMLELPRRAGLRVTEFRWRATAPTLVGEQVHALGWQQGSVLQLQAGAGGAWDRVLGTAAVANSPAGRGEDCVR